MKTTIVMAFVTCAAILGASDAAATSTSTRFSYDDAGRCAWEELLFRGKPEEKRQLSVHIPIGLHAVSDLLYCDCAFNAWKLPVPPDMKTGEKASDEIRSALTVDRVETGTDPRPAA